MSYLLGRRSPRGPGAVADPHLFQKMMTHVLRRPENGIIAIASHNGTPLSAVYLRNGPFCRFEYGVSDELRKEEVDTSHLFHWKVMAYMKASGCDVLDVGGAAPTLPQDHPGYGVNIFKTGFTKHFLKTPSDFTKCYRPGWISFSGILWGPSPGGLPATNSPCKLIKHPLNSAWN